MTMERDRKTEKDGTLWFVNRCEACPWLRKGTKRNPSRCMKLNMEIVDVKRVSQECLLELR